jgi:WD40 repeat protein
MSDRLLHRLVPDHLAGVLEGPAVQLAPTPDGCVVLTEGDRLDGYRWAGWVDLWDLETGEQKASHAIHGAAEGRDWPGVALDPRGRWYGPRGEGVDVYEALTGRQLASFAGWRAGAFERVAFDHAGRFVLGVNATGDDDFSETAAVRVWSTVSGRALFTLAELDAFHDGTDNVHLCASGRVALLWGDGRLRRFDLHRDGVELEALAADDCAWSADARWLAVVRGRDVTLRHHEMVVAHREAPSRSRVALTDCGQLLAVAHDGGLTLIFTDGMTVLAELPRSGAVASLRFTPAGDRLVLADQDGTLEVWDTTGLVETREVVQPPPPWGTPIPAWAREEASAPAGGWLARRDALWALEVDSGVTSAHHAATAELVAALPVTFQHPRLTQSALTAIALSPDRRYLACGSEVPVERWDEDGGAITIWELASGRCVHTVEVLGSGGVRHERGRRETTLLAWSPDSQRIAAAFRLNTVAVWDAFHGTTVPERMAYTAEGHDLPVTFAWSPDGSRLALGTFRGDGRPRIGHVPTTRAFSYLRSAAADWLQGTATPTDRTHRSLTWSADGAWLIEHGYDHLDVWSVASGGRTLALDGRISVSPGARWLLDPGTSKRPPRLWRPDGTEGSTLGTSAATAVAWSGGGTAVALASADGLQLWTDLDGTPVASVIRPTHALVHPDSTRYFRFFEHSAVALDNSGDTLACFTGPQTVEVWQSAGGRAPRHVVDVHPGAFGVAFDATGSVLVVWSRRRLEFWHVAGPDAVLRNAVDFPEQPAPTGPGPLAHSRGDRALATWPPAAFQVPSADGWTWATALPGGAVMGPADALQTDLGLVFGDRHAWPAHWLDRRR